MKTWQKILLINACGLLGLILSAFALPSDTPVWIWATVCTIILMSANCWFLLFKRKQPADPSQGSWLKTIIIVIGMVYFAAEVVMGIIHYAR